MIDFELTEEQRMMRDTAHKFAENEIRPVAAHYDEIGEMAWDVLKKAHEIGLTSYYFPEEYGGGGVLSQVTNHIVIEELSWGCAGIATAIVGTGLAAVAILGMGTEAQKKKYIPMFTDPKQLRIGAMALTEPQAGSDVKAISTTAVREGDEYVLNGRKCFITNGGIADVHVVFGTTDKSLGLMGLAAFVIDKDTPGLSMGKKENKLGVRASHTGEVILENCRVPVENRLGGEPGTEGAGPGAFGALSMLEISRPSVGAAAVGIARAALEYATQYATERMQMGRPIVRHQGIGFKLADMAMQVDAARLMVWRAGWIADKGLPFTRGEGSMAKCFAGDVAMRVTTDAVQILGGYGYMKDYPLEKWMRDAKIYQIWEGTNEIQRIVIARMLRA
jgi:acyl-CoA dehydrogenase